MNQFDKFVSTWYGINMLLGIIVLLSCIPFAFLGRALHRADKEQL